MMNTICTVVTNTDVYKKCIGSNNWLTNDLFHKVAITSNQGKSIPDAYNDILDSLMSNSQGWVLFCPQNFTLLESMQNFLESADSSALYGFFGYKKSHSLRNKTFYEARGNVILPTPADGFSLQNYIRIGGVDCRQDTEVDVISGGCLLIHSDLLRTLPIRFDTRLTSCFLIEKFSQLAKKKNIPCKLLPLECHLDAAYLPEKLTRVPQSENIAWHNLRQNALLDHPTFIHDQAHYTEFCEKASIEAAPFDHSDLEFPARYVVRAAEGVYSFPASAFGSNHPAAIAAAFMNPEKRVLDMGCAQGDVGAYFEKKCSSTLWGMEYNPFSIQKARQKNIYREVLHVDLEQLFLPDYNRFQYFFDYIFLGDILEHLRSPLDLLQKIASFLRDKGSLIVSLPNVGCGHVAANLLQQKFEYADTGILDATHLRFFTAKSQAELFAKAGYTITKASACFMPVTNWSYFFRKDFPLAFYEMLFSNKHFFVAQYVSELSLSDEAYDVKFNHNLQKLLEAPENNPEGWEKGRHKRELLALKIHLAQGGAYPPSIEDSIRAFMDKNDYFSAIEASMLFDDLWYVQNYPDSISDGKTPLEHYLTIGWQEGKKPSDLFDPEFYAKQFAKDTPVNGCPLLHYLSMGLEYRLSRVESSRFFGTYDAQKYVDSLFYSASDKSLYVEKNPQPAVLEANSPRVIAFYLPQFYPNAANDLWWGKGFTEWTNVTRALPQYTGHYQPHLPADLGLYDLRLKDVAKSQMELASHYGIYGFCYYHYWFGHQEKLLDMPVARHLASPDMRLPFCLAWANEPWTALWDGGNKKVLAKQPFKINVPKLFEEFFPFWKDSRYITVEGRPVFIVYRPTYHGIKDFKLAMDSLRQMVEKNGLPGLHIGIIQREFPPQTTLSDYGADAFVEFPPVGARLAPPSKEIEQIRTLNPAFFGRIKDMRELAKYFISSPTCADLVYKGVVPMWDNSPRKTETGCSIYENSSPELYESWLLHALQHTKEHNPTDHNLVFINAWNEWGEGAHLEPDRRYGFAYLEATKRALMRYFSL